MGKKNRRREKGAAHGPATTNAAPAAPTPPAASAPPAARPLTASTRSDPVGDSIRASIADATARQTEEARLNYELQPVLSAMTPNNNIEEKSRTNLIRRFFHILGIDLSSYDDNLEAFPDPIQATRVKYISKFSATSDLRYLKQWDLGICQLKAVLALRSVLHGVDDESSIPIHAALASYRTLKEINLDPQVFQVLNQTCPQQSIPGTFQELTDFALFCSVGNADMVEKMIVKLTMAGSQERKNLLERKETSFRLSPLLLTTRYAYLKHSNDNEGIDLAGFTKVVNVLLCYGANPFSKDIWGFSVLHYALDALQQKVEPANFSTVFEPIAKACIEASMRYPLVNKLVKLKGLSKADLNGRVGHCGGFSVQHGRYSVHLRNQYGSTFSTRLLGLKPENLELESEDSFDAMNTDETPLVDMVNFEGLSPLGAIAFEGTRADMAKFLLQHDASVDVGDGFQTARCLANVPIHFANPGQPRLVQAPILKHISKMVKKAGQDSKVCAQCGAKEEGTKKFPTCSVCLSVWYCGRKCQKQHYRMHKMDCSAKKVTLGPRSQVELKRLLFFYNSIECTQKDALEGGYNPPVDVDVEEKFALKITIAREDLLLCYDESHTCCFLLEKKSKGFQELFDSILPDWKDLTASERLSQTFGNATGGTSKYRHFFASFSELGDCSIYLNSSWYGTSF